MCLLIMELESGDVKARRDVPQYSPSRSQSWDRRCSLPQAGAAGVPIHINRNRKLRCELLEPADRGRHRQGCAG